MEVDEAIITSEADEEREKERLSVVATFGILIATIAATVTGSLAALSSFHGVSGRPAHDDRARIRSQRAKHSIRTGFLGGGDYNNNKRINPGQWQEESSFPGLRRDPRPETGVGSLARL